MEKEIKEITEKELKDIVSGIVAGETKKMEEKIEGLQKDIKLSSEDKSVRNAKISKKFIKDLMLTGQVEGKAISTDSGSFGYTVPITLASKILEKRDKIAKMRKYAYSFKMAGKYQLSKEGTAVTSYWVTENNEVTESNPTTSKNDLDDYYLCTRVLIPYKLLDTSAVNVEEFVGNLSSRSIKSKEETAFVAGDGSGQPTGFRQESVGEVQLDGSSLGYKDITELFYTLEEQYRQNAVFITSTKGLRLVKEILDSNNRPIFDVRDQTLFGRPLIECVDIPDDLQTNGDATEIWFADLSYYWIKDGVRMVAERDKIISKMQVEMVLHQSIDGAVVNTDAFKVLTGVK